MTADRRRNAARKLTSEADWDEAPTERADAQDAGRRLGDVRLGPDSIAALRERGFSNEEIYAIVAPRRTLARRLAGKEQLSVAESDRVLRLERISEQADRVFGNHEKAQRWLRKESRALDNARPIELLRSETGAHFVEEELHRIDYGMFS